jgi:predicted GNAT family acetyltransferase
MLKATVYSDIYQFHADTYEILLSDEVKNLIILGNLLIGTDGTDRTGWRNVDNWFMATVKNDADVILTALMTPPHNLTLYETNNVPNDEALRVLVERIAGDTAVPGVMSESGLALRFAKIYNGATKNDFKVTENQRIYALTEVNEAYLRGSYVFRPADDRDMSFLPYWCNGFHNDCYQEKDNLQTSFGIAEHYLSGKRLYILEDNGVAVSMAGNHRNMRNAGGVGPVYTPPYFRNRGYASACVARLSKQILESGKKYCVLYTNLANPVSNSIYQKIGYNAVCYSRVIMLH